MLVTLASGVAAYAAASLRPARYTAEGVAVVAANDLLTPDQAIGLAVTDAALIPKDAAIERSVALAVGTTAKDVRGRLSAFSVPRR